MKIRVQQSPLMVGLVEGLGAVATPLDYGEVYSALQTGVVDGAENNWPSYLSTSHFEVAKYFITDEHTRVPEIMVGSKRVFDKLSKEDQELHQARPPGTPMPFQIKLWNDYEMVAEKAVREKGSTVITEVTPGGKDEVHGCHEAALRQAAPGDPHGGGANPGREVGSAGCRPRQSRRGGPSGAAAPFLSPYRP